MDSEVSATNEAAAKRHTPLPVRQRRIGDLIPLRNPLLLASGPLGAKASSMIKHAEFAGGVVTKTTTWDPCTGNPTPRVRRLSDDSMMNWEGVPNLGFKQSVEELKIFKQRCQCAVIASIWPGELVDKVTEMAAGFEEAGADAVELDFKWGLLDDDKIIRTCKALKKTISIPVIAKLSVFAGDVCEHGRMVEDAGCDAITAINSIAPAMKIDVRRQQPVLASGHGGLSGAPILPFAVAAVHALYKTVSVPIIGCGGVTCGEAALELIMVGADAIQMCTTPMLEGPTAFRRVLDEMQALVKELGFASIEACCGVVHRV